MRARFVLINLALLAAATAACTDTARPDSAKEEAAIRAADARWLAAAQAHDLERTVSYWSDDAVVMQPGAAPIQGRDAIRRYVTAAFASPGFSITWVTHRIHVAGSGDVAYATGRDVMRMTSPEGRPVVENNKSVAVWRKEPDGAWRCVVDIWNAEP